MIANQTGKLTSEISTDKAIIIVGLEITMSSLVKENHNGHHFTEGQSGFGSFAWGRTRFLSQFPFSIVLE